MDRIRNVAVVGNYLPRMCGIATFTTDLVQAISSSLNEDDSCWALAMNDRPEGYKYPEKVRFEINQNRPIEYRLASDYININQADVVCLQHEYGIFGGQTGNYLLQLLNGLRMPVVTTLHTVLRDPTPEQKKILKKVAAISSRVVVMAKRAQEYLTDIYDVPAEKVAFIHHGIPDIPFVDPNFYKDQFGVEGKKVILTFGLLSQNKGIEYMIRAMPDVVKKHPSVMYIVLGATHPHVKQAQGEEYRVGLERMARNLGVGGNIMFFNRFVELKELCEFLGSADVYVTPYLTEAQIVSGTLAYAMGVGKATVSTRYWYAEEMVGDGRGILVDFKNPQQLAEAVNKLLEDDVLRNAMRKRAYMFSRNAVWSQVGKDYLRVFNEATAERRSRPHPVLESMTLDREKESLPELRLDHLLMMTDDTGMLQHASYTVPDCNHGYCIDDNARALILAVSARGLGVDSVTLSKLEKRYLGFIKHAYNEDLGWFRNFMAYDRRWLEDRGSEDSQGRTLWALGVNCALSVDPGAVALSTTLFHKGLPIMEQLHHPRALAFALVGIHAYLARFSGDSEVRRLRETIADKLLGYFSVGLKKEWPWFESTVTYANAKIPQALLLSGQWLQRGDMLEKGYAVLDWLIDIQTEDGRFSPIGNRGWLTASGEKARFDQQPIETQAMVETCLLAYRMTDNDFYFETARKAFSWFLGQNDLSAVLYDYATAGCRDGLSPDGPNLNQGAESTLAWLLSLVAMHSMETDQKKLQYVESIDESMTS